MHLAKDKRPLPPGAFAFSLILCLLIGSCVACGDNANLANPQIAVTPVGGELAKAEISSGQDGTDGSQSPIPANVPVTFTPLSTSVLASVPTSTSTIPNCTSQGTIETLSISSAIAGYDIPVQIYLPACYGKDGRYYPVIYLFHGGSYDETHWVDLGVVEAAESGISSDILPPVIIVMPGGGLLADTTSGGSASYEGFILDELIPFIESQYCASPESKNRAIGGISRGGYWALEIAFRFPEAFSSVGGHSAALLDTFAGPDMNPRYTGLNNDLFGLRIYLDIGEKDWVISDISSLHEEMEAAGITHTWLLNPGSHDDEYWASHIFEYLEWYTRIWPKERLAYNRCATTITESFR